MNFLPLGQGHKCSYNLIQNRINLLHAEGSGLYLQKFPYLFYQLLEADCLLEYDVHIFLEFVVFSQLPFQPLCETAYGHNGVSDLMGDALNQMTHSHETL